MCVTDCQSCTSLLETKVIHTNVFIIFAGNKQRDRSSGQPPICVCVCVCLCVRVCVHRCVCEYALRIVSTEQFASVL